MKTFVKLVGLTIGVLIALYAILFFAAWLADEVYASGTTINGGRTILGKWDASTATQTLPVKADTSLPESCTVNEMFWLTTETDGRGLYLCTATDTWQAVGWSVGEGPPATCTTGGLYFDTNADPGSNLMVCSATDTWTRVDGSVPTPGSAGNVSGTSTTVGLLAYWTGTDGIGETVGLSYDGTDQLLATNLTVSNTITGSVSGNAGTADLADKLSASWSGSPTVSLVICGIVTPELCYDENGNGTPDANDWCIQNGGLDLDWDCTADADPLFTTIMSMTDSGEVLFNNSDAWVDGDPEFLWNWTRNVLSIYPLTNAGIDLTFDATPVADIALTTTADGIELMQSAEVRGAKTIDSNGDGTADLDTAWTVGGNLGDGVNAQRGCLFPGGYSSDPFDYAAGFCSESRADGSGAFYPVVSDPNYATLTSGPYADLGTSTYRWREGYINKLYVNTATFNNLGYTNTYEPSIFWKAGGGQTYTADSDYDDSAQRYFKWYFQTGVSTSAEMFHIDGDASPEMWTDLNGDGTVEFKLDLANSQFCLDPDDNANCDFIFKDYGTDLTPVVGIAFHGATTPTIVHNDSAKTLNFDLDEDGTYEMTVDGSASQVTLDPNSDGVNDMLLNQTFLQTDQIRYSTESSARMTATNSRMHMCGGNQFAPNAAAGACMSLGGSTGTYANAVYFDPDGDGTNETNINNLGVYSGQATTAGALATDPTGCTNQFVTDMAAAGALTCNSVTGGYVTDGSLLAADLTWDSTATRTAGQYIQVGSDTTKFLAVTRTEVLTWSGATGVATSDPAIFKAPWAFTITGISCIVYANTSIPVSVEECDANAGSCAGVDGATTITCDTDGAADDGSLSNPSIDANDWIKLNFGSATGTIIGASVTIKYTIP